MSPFFNHIKIGIDEDVTATSTVENNFNRYVWMWKKKYKITSFSFECFYPLSLMISVTHNCDHIIS